MNWMVSGRLWLLKWVPVWALSMVLGWACAGLVVPAEKDGPQFKRVVLTEGVDPNNLYVCTPHEGDFACVSMTAHIAEACGWSYKQQTDQQPEGVINL